MALRERTVAENSSIDLNRLRVFVQVVDGGSFTGAAKRLGVPKSSVSRSVTMLERSLGVRLLQRTTRALSLTDAGRSYYQQVRPALASLVDSSASVRALGTEPRGRVRMSCAPEAAELVAGYVAAFRTKHPEVQVEVSFTGRHVDLVAEGFDLALRGGTLRDSSLISRKISEVSLGLYASPAYLRRRGMPKALADLRRHDCVGLAASPGRAVWTLTDSAGVQASVEVQLAVTSDLLVFTARAALLGSGIVLLPEVLAGAAVEEGALVRVLPGVRRDGGALSVVTPSRAFEPLAVALFKEGLVRALTRLVASRCPKAAGKALTTGPREELM